MSDARPITSGEDERTIRRSFLRASASPASALSERARSSARRPLVSSDSSSPLGVCPGLASDTSVLSSASVEPGGYEVGPGEDLRGLRNLQDRGSEALQVLQLAFLARLLGFSQLPFDAVLLGGQLTGDARAHVRADDPS